MTRPILKSLQNNEKIQWGDIVEDLNTGYREPVEVGKFYNFLVGCTAEQAKNMPTIYDILRKEA